MGVVEVVQEGQRVGCARGDMACMDTREAENVTQKRERHEAANHQPNRDRAWKPPLGKMDDAIRSGARARRWIIMTFAAGLVVPANRAAVALNKHQIETWLLRA